MSASIIDSNHQFEKGRGLAYNGGKSKAMNKPKLVNALVERTKAPKEVAADFVNALFENIVDELEKGNKVTIGNFGTFYLVRHKDRVTTHPSQKSTVNLPPLTLAKFRPSQRLKEAINRKIP